MLQNVERCMPHRVALQHSQRTPNPDEALLRVSNRVTAFEPHIDHLVAKAVRWMRCAARVWQQDKTPNMLPISNGSISVHHVAEGAYHGARRDCAGVQRVSAAFQLWPGQDHIPVRACLDRGQIKQIWPRRPRDQNE